MICVVSKHTRCALLVYKMHSEPSDPGLSYAVGHVALALWLRGRPCMAGGCAGFGGGRWQQAPLHVRHLEGTGQHSLEGVVEGAPVHGRRTRLLRQARRTAAQAARSAAQRSARCRAWLRASAKRPPSAARCCCGSSTATTSRCAQGIQRSGQGSAGFHTLWHGQESMTDFIHAGLYIAVRAIANLGKGVAGCCAKQALAARLTGGGIRVVPSEMCPGSLVLVVRVADCMRRLKGVSD